MERTRNLIASLTINLVILSAPGLHAGEIHDAVVAGDLDKVEALVTADPSLLEAKDSMDNTPLIAACRNRQVAIASFLIDKGADVNARGRGGMTPLFAFPYDMNLPFDLIERLVTEGADVNAKLWLNRNWTVIVDYVRKGNVQVAQLLIDHGADLNIRDIEGTPLHMAINHNRPFVGDLALSRRLHEEMAKCLVQNGARLQEFSFGNTDLHLAALRGFADLVPVLVRHGAEVNATNDYGHTPLYYATRHGHRQTAEALIAAGADQSTIVETNYGKAPQLTEPIKAGEAWLWNLACEISPHTGYVVKTRNHLLIFDPAWIHEAPEAGLANGYLNPQELAGQNITVLTTLPMISISEPAKRLPDADFVLCSEPTVGAEEDGDIPPYRLAVAHESFSVDGIRVHPIPAASRLFGREGLGYLVQTDGVKVFHAGLHFSDNNPSTVTTFRQEIDFLKPFGPVDIAILPIKGRHLESVAYEPYLYLVDQLSPRAVYLIAEELANEEHRKCLDVLKARDVPVFYPDGGIALGQRFHYQKPDSPEFTDLHGDYLGQTPPGDTPVVFARGLVSTDDLEHSAPMFSPDGNEVFWHVNRPPGPNNSDWISFTKTMRRLGNRWTALETSPFKHPFYSMDGSRLYFFGDGKGPYYVDKKDDRWGEPQRIDLIDRFPELQSIYITSVTRDGTLYFTGIVEGLGTMHDHGIYRVELVNGEYAGPELLPRIINQPPFNNWTPFIAPDESYLIFSSNRACVPGDDGDLYISFHNVSDDTWSEPMNMGEPVNSRTQERLPHISPDGKYLFFTRWTPDHDQDVFWVSAKIIERLKAEAIEQHRANGNTAGRDSGSNGMTYSPSHVVGSQEPARRLSKRA